MMDSHVDTAPRVRHDNQSTKYREDIRRYISSLAVTQLAFAISVLLLLVLASSIGRVLVPGALIVSIILPVGIITVAVQIQEYFRQTFFTRLVPIKAFSIDLIRCGFQVTAIVILYLTGILSGKMAFWAIGLASMVSAAEGFRRFPILIGAISEWRKSLSERG